MFAGSEGLGRRRQRQRHLLDESEI